MTNQADKFFNDPRVIEGKKLILEALKEHQAPINKVKGPIDQDSDKQYQKLLAEFGKNRGAATFYPYLGSGIGNGPLVELADGSVKYDFITGIGVHYFGHSHLGFVGATLDGAIANTAMQGHLQQNVDSAKLVKLLVEQANKYGSQLNSCFLTSSGVMAGENALKLAFQKNHPAHRVLAFKGNFAGRTLAVSQITDKAAYRTGLPTTLQVDYVPFYDYQNHQGSIDCTLACLQELVTRYPQQHAVFMMELIQGENGSWPGNTEYFQAVCEFCLKHNIAIIFDEVQSFGRTSELFAFQHFKLDKYAQLVTIGKNSQVCATLYTDHYKPQAGLISQTFTSSSSAIHASYFVITQLVQNHFLGENGKIEKLRQHFLKHLEELHKKYPSKIEGPWGIGAMIGMTLFKGDLEQSKKFSHQLFKNGVISFIAGNHPNVRVRFLLPVGALENQHIDDAINILDQTLAEF